MEATLASIIAAAAPLIYAAVGEAITERAGIVNLSLDGSILLSAMAGFGVAYTTGSVGLGFLAGRRGVGTRRPDRRLVGYRSSTQPGGRRLRPHPARCRALLLPR